MCMCFKCVFVFKSVFSFPSVFSLSFDFVYKCPLFDRRSVFFFFFPYIQFCVNMLLILCASTRV